MRPYFTEISRKHSGALPTLALAAARRPSRAVARRPSRAVARRPSSHRGGISQTVISPRWNFGKCDFTEVEFRKLNFFTPKNLRFFRHQNFRDFFRHQKFHHQKFRDFLTTKNFGFFSPPKIRDFFHPPKFRDFFHHQKFRNFFTTKILRFSPGIPAKLRHFRGEPPRARKMRPPAYDNPFGKGWSLP